MRGTTAERDTLIHVVVISIEVHQRNLGRMNQRIQKVLMLFIF